MKTDKIKEQHHAGRLIASGVSLTTAIELHHNNWCRENGYPVTSYKPQAGRPKASSFKRQASKASGGKPQAPSCRPQASSRKPQAA